MSGGFGRHSHWANARVRALPSGLDDLLGVGMAFAQQRGQEEVFRLPIRFASRLSHRTTTECSIMSSPGSNPGRLDPTAAKQKLIAIVAPLIAENSLPE